MIGVCLYYSIASKEFHISICLFVIAVYKITLCTEYVSSRRERAEERAMGRNADIPILFSFPSGAAGLWVVGCLDMDFD